VSGQREPVIVRCRDANAEAQAVLNWVRELIAARQLKSHEICVTPYKHLILQALHGAGNLTHELKDREEDLGEKVPGVRLGSMKRIKGLEFRAVAMACADQHDPLHHHLHAEALSRCEYYVAATGAREYLLVTLPETWSQCLASDDIAKVYGSCSEDVLCPSTSTPAEEP
jgi:hypothetical protein